MKKKAKSKLKAVDFFCGAGGMSYGLQKAGIKILGGIDLDSACEKTYTSNLKNAKYIKEDITLLSCRKLKSKLKLKVNDDSLVFAGCSPCQYWSKIKTDKTKSQKSAFLLKAFQKFIGHFKPGFIIVENVPGLLKNKKESILPDFLTFLRSQGYAYADGIISADDYGVPQKRQRYLLVATRLATQINLPPKKKNDHLVVRNYLGVANGFKKIEAGTKDTTQFIHTAAHLSENNLRRIKITPPDGGDRSAWKNNIDLQIDAYINKDHIFRNIYSRMYWDRPAPTITTRFNSLSNGRFGHPEENRAISLREGATLQTFPKKFKFRGSNQACIARQIGNAVPPELACHGGRHLIKIASNG
jgi:DNA (cytosine-5)-methyltransferase 1